MGLFIGKSIDLGNGRRAAQIGFAVLGIAVIARAIGYPYGRSAVAANAAAAIAWPIYATAFNSRVYALAQQSALSVAFSHRRRRRFGPYSARQRPALLRQA